MADHAAPTPRHEILETSFISGENAAFIAQVYRQFLSDPNSVDASWRNYFDGLGDGAALLSDDFAAPQWPATAPPTAASPSATASSPNPEANPEASKASIQDLIQLLLMIRNYRVLGHLQAKLDPLGLLEAPIILI